MDVRSLTATLRELYERTARYFLPPSIAADREAANQARMFLVSHLFGPPMSLSVPLALWAADPTPGYAVVVLAAGIAAFLAFPFLMKRGVSYRKLVLLSILNLNFVIFWSCFHYGGVHSPTLVWTIIIPILSVFYIGGDERRKRELVALSAASASVFMVLYLWLDPAPSDIPPSALKVLGATSAAAVMCYVAVMAVYYARIFDAGVDLEREVARRRLMSIELRRAMEAADRAASMKSEFLARMSHELRSPLNAIVGYGELLREECEEEDEVMGRDLDQILVAGAYLTRLIDMILDLAKIEAGKMRFNPQPVDLAETLDEVARRNAEAIAANGNHIDIWVDPGIGEVSVDFGRLLQIVDSIVQNAAIATRDGNIAILARLSQLDGCPAFAITVEDTGRGIPAEILPVIFETFLVDRQAAEGRYGGTGLALSVSSKLCEAMGGRLTAESREGVGSVFTVTLPLLPAASVAAPALLAHAA